MTIRTVGSLPTAARAPYEGIAGTVPMRWLVVPRPEYRAQVRVERRTGVAVVTRGTDALARLNVVDPRV